MPRVILRELTEDEQRFAAGSEWSRMLQNDSQVSVTLASVSVVLGLSVQATQCLCEPFVTDQGEEVAESGALLIYSWTSDASYGPGAKRRVGLNCPGCTLRNRVETESVYVDGVLSWESP